MEDTYCHKDGVAGDKMCGLWGIFDGHGGKQVSEHCAETFPLILKKELAKMPHDLYQVLENSFLDVDKMLTMIDSNHCGSTAVIAVLRKEQ